MTENITGYLSSLAYGAATGTSLPAFGSDTYTNLPDIEQAKPSSGARDVQSWKVLDQAASKKIIGSIEYDAITGTLTRAFDSAAQTQMRNDANSGVPVRRNYRFQFNNVGQEIHYCAGYCSKFAYGDTTNDGRVTVDLEITVDGAVTIVD